MTEEEFDLGPMPHECEVSTRERAHLWTYTDAELWDLYYHHEEEISSDYWLMIEGALADRKWPKR